jgi:hypothetical protein
MAEDMEAGEDQVGDQDEEQEKMEGRIEPAVVLEILTYSWKALLSARPGFAASDVWVSGETAAAALWASSPALSGFCGAAVGTVNAERLPGPRTCGSLGITWEWLRTASVRPGRGRSPWFPGFR